MSIFGPKTQQPAPAPSAEQTAAEQTAKLDKVRNVQAQAIKQAQSYNQQFRAPTGLKL